MISHLDFLLLECFHRLLFSLVNICPCLCDNYSLLVFLFPFDLDVDHVNLLSPVTTVQLGDPVTLLCVFPEEEFSDEQMYWYKQTVGGIPQLVSSMQKYLTEPVFHSGFNNSHFNIKLDQIMFRLTIMNLIPEDEAMYYCAIGREMNVKFRDGTFLFFKK